MVKQVWAALNILFRGACLQIWPGGRHLNFVTFVDFKEAYDTVPINVLFLTLKRLSCGMTMLFAIKAMYRITKCTVDTALVTATIGMHQWSPTSCLLFVIFMNELIGLMRQTYGVDGFLAWLHGRYGRYGLLSTTRFGMVNKIKLLSQFCVSYGLKINIGKTIFLL